MDSNNIMENKAVTFVLTIGIIIGFLFLLSTLNSTENQIGNKILSTIYTTTTVNVRSCASFNCGVVGTYPPNTSFDTTNLGITDISQLSEWYSFEYPSVEGGPNDLTGYINKSVLSDHETTQSESISDAPTFPPGCTSNVGYSSTTGMSCAASTVPSKPMPSTTNKDLASIVKEWSPRIAHIACTNDFKNYSVGSATFSGLTNSNDGLLYPVLLTNAHVVVLDGYRYTSCGFNLTGDSQVYLLDTSTFDYSRTQDVEYIVTSQSTWLNPGITMPNIGKMRICQTFADIGDKVLILGYPSAGGTGGSVTATEGIISSYDGQYYVTSAKIDHGNSGGAAILVKDDCYLGIPTWAESGGFESYGRILSKAYFLESN